MKFRLKLLKAYSADGVTHEAGTVIEVTDKSIAQSLCFEGIAEKHVEEQVNVEAVVAAAVEKGIASFSQKNVERATASVKDLEMADPTCGYGPRVESGRARTKAEKEATLAAFASDVYDAAVNQRPSAKLMKMSDVRAERIQKAVQAGRIDKAALTGMELGTNNHGGYLLPSESSTMLVETSALTAVIRPMATSIPMGNQSLDLPQFLNYDESTNAQIYGGVYASWDGENSTLSTTRPKMENVELKLNRVTAFAAASHQMMKFSPISVGGFLLPALAQAIAKAEDNAFIGGDGVKKPLGVIGAPGTISIAIEANQTIANGVVVTKNVLKMFQQLLEVNPGSVKWLYNKLDLFVALASLKREVGTAGSTDALLREITGAPAMSLIGLPIVNSQYCKAGGTPGDIILGDWSQYLVGDDRSGVELAQSSELLFDVAQNAFRAIRYVAGQPRYKQAFTRLNSTNTASPFVTLAVRS